MNKAIYLISWTMGLCLMGQTLAQEKIPSMEEISTMIDSGREKDAQKITAQILSGKIKEGADYPRHSVFILKAEAEIRMKDSKLAISTLETARKEDDKNAAIQNEAEDVALKELVQQSKGWMYHPLNTPDASPIDITDRTNRKKGYEALYTDQAARLKQEISNAKEELTIQTLQDFSNRFYIAQSIELTLSGETRKSEKLGMDLSRWSGNVVEKGLSNFDIHLKRMGTKYSNKKLRREKDIDAEDENMLRQIRNTSAQIPELMQQLDQQLGHPILLNSQKLMARASNINDRAEGLLKRIGD